jgi:glutamate/tyrosine decarboxylase-like PLP-dependent enzyme
MPTTLPDEVERRIAPIEMSAEAFRTAGHALVDQIATWLDGLRDGAILRDESVTDVRSVLGAERTLPHSGCAPGPLLDEAAQMLFGHSLFNGHPRFFGYITSSPAPIGALADLLASAINQNVGAWRLSPLATEIEAQTVRWIAEFVGFPTEAGGLLVSGGNMANFVGFLAARAAAAPQIRTTGVRALSGVPRVYASAEAHTWLHKAVDLFGLGTDAIRWIAVDAEQRMDVTALEAQIRADRAAGDVPFLVVGTAGSVSTGAVDPLAEIANNCRQHDLWFHVDGAYGAFAARVPGSPASLLALRDADSIAVDPHKWLYAPLEAGCALVRRREDLRRAFSYHPPYFHFDHEVTNYFDYGPQNSRGFRALKVWLALRQVGLSGYLQMIGDDICLARHLHTLVQQHPDFEAITQHLSITTFRYVPADLKGTAGSAETEAYLQRLNQELLARIERSGEAFLSNAVVDGRFALRVCIVNFRTTADDLDALLTLLVRLGHEVDAALRIGATLAESTTTTLRRGDASRTGAKIAERPAEN